MRNHTTQGLENILSQKLNDSDDTDKEIFISLAQLQMLDDDLKEFFRLYTAKNLAPETLHLILIDNQFSKNLVIDLQNFISKQQKTHVNIIGRDFIPDTDKFNLFLKKHNQSLAGVLEILEPKSFETIIADRIKSIIDNAIDQDMPEGNIRLNFSNLKMGNAGLQYIACELEKYPNQNFSLNLQGNQINDQSRDNLLDLALKENVFELDISNNKYSGNSLKYLSVARDTNIISGSQKPVQRKKVSFVEQIEQNNSDFISCSIC